MTSFKPLVMEELLHTFYKSFKALDGDQMAACYHKDIIFEDPAFGVLKGEHAKNMWRMLCDSQQGKDFNISYSQVEATATEGSARWEAHYKFSKTERPVHNRIKATFQFQDGKIIRHSDHFPLHNWAKQAMGFKGWLLGGTAYFKKELQKQTRNMLAKYEASI